MESTEPPIDWDEFQNILYRSAEKAVMERFSTIFTKVDLEFYSDTGLLPPGVGLLCRMCGWTAETTYGTVWDLMMLADHECEGES